METPHRPAAGIILKADMTLQVRIQVPKANGPYEAKVEQTGSATPIFLEPGDELNAYVHSGNEIRVTEVPAGTKANGGVPPGAAPAAA